MWNKKYAKISEGLPWILGQENEAFYEEILDPVDNLQNALAMTSKVGDVTHLNQELKQTRNNA